MGVSQSLRDNDIRALLRLVGETAELPHDQARRQQHILGRLCQLLGAQVGICVKSCGFLPGRQPRLASVADTGWENNRARQMMTEFLATGRPAEPMGDAMMLQQGPLVTRYRQQLIPDRVWYAQPGVNEYRRACNLDHCLYSGLVSPGFDQIACISLHRPWGEKPFNERERKMLDLLHSEISWIHKAERADDDPRVRALPPYLQRVLRCLLDGDAEKQAAAKLDLSHHSVHEYVKQLYRRLGVSSRGELVALWLPRWRQNASALPPS